jgi:hypothetical protein
MADGSLLGATLAYLGFVAFALVGPSLAIFRIARVRLDESLVLPVGLVQCAALYWLSLVCHVGWLFPLSLAALNLLLLLLWLPPRLPETPSLWGALPAFFCLVLAFALTEYPVNRVGPRGEFLFDNVVPEDSAFHAALAWELTTSYPPDVPGLSGVPMGYHLGLPLVRAAATRWAGVHPYDSMSRFEITLVALGLLVALRGMTRLVGGAPRALALVSFTLLATDFSFVFASRARTDLWLDLTDANIFFSLAHANSSVAAILIALAALIALDRFLKGEGTGFLFIAVLLSAAVPHFKVFVGAQYLLGLAVAALVTRRFREPALMGAPALLGLLGIVLGPASHNMEVLLDPLRIVQRFRADLGLAPAGGIGLALWALVWVVASLGLRLFGIPSAFEALRSRRPSLVCLAVMALSGWPIGILFRVTPLDFPGRPPYNEAWYFIEQSAPLLWIFTALGLSRLRLRPLLLFGGAAALALPSTIQFVMMKRATPTVSAPPALVLAMRALAKEGRRGDVVLQRPEPKRFPPTPMVLVGFRIPYTRFIPYLYQTAPPSELRVRIETVRRFFHTTDPREAVGIARELDAHYLCLYGGDDVAFPIEGVLRGIYEEPNARVYEILGVP